jgi:hypothetical protein
VRAVLADLPGLRRAATGADAAFARPRCPEALAAAIGSVLVGPTGATTYQATA